MSPSPLHATRSLMGNEKTGGRLVAALLVVHASLLAWGASQHSPTLNEPAHLAAGLSHWHFGRFDLYRVNPPLVRLVAALPVMFAGPNVDWNRFYADRTGRCEMPLGRYLVTVNGTRSLRLLTLARWACIPFSLLGGYVCFRWAKELYGPTAGLTALSLWCFSPNIVAHAQLITPDAGAAALGVAAGYSFWRWLRRPEWQDAILAGVTLGLAELAKTIWIPLFLLWPLVWAGWQLRDPRNTPRAGRLRQVRQLAMLLLLALYLINLGYAFEGSFRRLGRFDFVSRALTVHEEAAEGRDQLANRFQGTCLGAVPAPLPANYLGGIDLQKRDFDRKMWSYLRGQWRRGGWWYYYLYALAVKVPLGTSGLLLLALFATTTLRGYSAGWPDELTLLAPPAVLLILVSSQTGFNHHLRYVLPVFPFVFVWASKVAGAVDREHWKLASLAAAAILWSVTSSLWVYPHSLSYFNALAGGPTRGHEHLLHSNVDWGQDLLYLKRWIDAHPEARPIAVAFEDAYDPEIVGIRPRTPPAGPGSRDETASAAGPKPGPQPGWHALGVGRIRSRTGEYAYFLHFQPVATAGYSISIYHISPEEANRVRKNLGLPALE